MERSVHCGSLCRCLPSLSSSAVSISYGAFGSLRPHSSLARSAEAPRFQSPTERSVHCDLMTVRRWSWTPMFQSPTERSVHCDLSHFAIPPPYGTSFNLLRSVRFIATPDKPKFKGKGKAGFNLLRSVRFIATVCRASFNTPWSSFNLLRSVRFIATYGQ